jgi:hypothetical protein
MRSTPAAALLALALAVATSVVVHTQAGQTKPAEGQKPAAKPHDMTGCLAKGDTATTYRLTNVEGGKVKTVDIIETAAALKLDAHVGHRVTITGTTVTAPKAEAGKKPMGEHYMRVEGVKHVAPTCP